MTGRYDFFGLDKILFGTYIPFNDLFGDRAAGATIVLIEQMEAPDIDKRKIFEDNAKRIFHLTL